MTWTKEHEENRRRVLREEHRCSHPEALIRHILRLERENEELRTRLHILINEGDE